MAKQKILERFIFKSDDLDPASRQAYILKLAKERGFFSTIFNTIEEGIMVVDRRLKIQYCNEAAQQMLGLPEDTQNIRVSQLLQGVDWRRIVDMDSNEWIKVARQEVEICYPEPRFLQFYLVPYPEDTQLAAVILRDVTETRSCTVKKLEDETANAVSLLAAGVAHEIGNPLNSLYLNLQILEKSIAGNQFDLKDAAEMVGICKKEVERLDSIIHRFLGSVRPKDLKLEPVDISKLIVEVLTFMRYEIEGRQVEVKCHWSDNLPPVNADPEQIKQVFYNIIRNAVQAMPNGGNLNIFGFADEDFLNLEFTDSGSGITPLELTNMFKAFKTGKSGGNGLGTMIIERICREHGAEFGVESQPGKGTTFCVRFPLHAKRFRMLPQ